MDSRNFLQMSRGNSYVITIFASRVLLLRPGMQRTAMLSSVKHQRKARFSRTRSHIRRCAQMSPVPDFLKNPVERPYLCVCIRSVHQRSPDLCIMTRATGLGSGLITSRYVFQNIILRSTPCRSVQEYLMSLLDRCVA